METAPNTPLHTRGAEWRKWDLHVHSPASHNFSGDWPGFVIQLGNSDCAVIGINDYFSVAGYQELLAKLSDPHEGANGNKAYREALAKLKDKTLLPVIECRMTNVVLGKKNTSGQRINFRIQGLPGLVDSRHQLLELCQGVCRRGRRHGSNHRSIFLPPELR